MGREKRKNIIPLTIINVLHHCFYWNSQGRASGADAGQSKDKRNLAIPMDTRQDHKSRQ